MHRPKFLAANLSAATMMFAMLATTVYVSEFLQTFRDDSPLQAGLALEALFVKLQRELTGAATPA